MTTKISNIHDLRNDLISAYEHLRNGELGIDEAKEISNMSGKIMKTCHLQLKHNEMTGSKEPIPFLQHFPTSTP